MAGSDGAALAGDLPPSLSATARPPWVGDELARRTHPVVLWYGSTYGVVERVPGGWMMSGMERMSPQDARDSLAWWFRNMARFHATGADRASFFEGAELLEQGHLDEVTAAGRVFRVIRADRFCRFGMDGPEPPRPTDPDDLPEPRTRRDPARFDHGLLPPARPMSGAELVGEHVPGGPGVPAEVTRDARRALATHPGVVRLATRFAAAERENGTWPPHGPFLHSPARVRDHLAAYFDMLVPKMLRPSPAVLAEYRAAAALLRDGTCRAEVTVLGRLFRVVRVEYVVRTGPDGPETPRPSDRDPDDHRSESGEFRCTGPADDDQ
ncbi:DUF5954 family protein [Actinomadura sp. GC306]|uniref:DUF5954 family protein n=1 Tax=Actinomadura sp. GC306 TaxID=2530367 RepID=UPI001FB79A0D|nr:DUF5954 family protein [Actinomadura sp. GC306]